MTSWRCDLIEALPSLSSGILIFPSGIAGVADLPRTVVHDVKCPGKASSAGILNGPRSRASKEVVNRGLRLTVVRGPRDAP